MTEQEQKLELSDLEYESSDDDAQNDGGKEKDRSAKARLKSQRVVRNYFEKHLAKGRILSLQALHRFAIQRDLEPRPSKSFLRDLRLEYKASAVRTERRKPKLYSSAAIPLYGCLFVDYW